MGCKSRASTASRTDSFAELAVPENLLVDEQKVYGRSCRSSAAGSVFVMRVNGDEGTRKHKLLITTDKHRVF